ncbi:MAG: MFS transporter [Dehalococcoidia bacterium]|nr:MFS transporter [Dehalococcoidia bacterium]
MSTPPPPSTPQPGHGLLGLPHRLGRVFYGWWIVAVCFVGYFMIGGLYSHGLAVYFLPLTRDLGLSRGQLSFAFTMRAFEGGVDGPIVGYLVDRFGPRFMMRAGVTLAGLGFVLLATTQEFVSFLLVFVGLLGVGVSAGIHHACLAIMNQWFARHRAMAMTIGFLGGEFGGALLTPLVALMVLNQGWREAALWSGLLIPAVILPCTLLLHNNPEAIGLRRDGDAEPPVEASRPKVAPASHDFTVKQALHTMPFWRMAIAVGVRLFGKSALQIHFVPLLVWKGLGEQDAGVMVAVLALGQVPARLVGAWLGDRWSMTRVPALAALGGVGAVAVLLFGPQDSAWVGVLFALLFACGEGGNLVAWGLIGDYYGRRNYATLRGMVNLISSPLSLPAATWMGWVFDNTGSYSGALIPVAVGYTLSFLLYTGLKRPSPVGASAEPVSGS